MSLSDLEISKALALAIGWPVAKYFEWLGGVMVTDGKAGGWFEFDYRDWAVAGPIAAKLIVELIKCKSYHIEYWQAIHGMEDDLDHAVATADTPQKAIALAVIQGAKT